LRAESAAFQALIREIHHSEEQHQRAEHDLGAAQLSTAKSLNRITAIGATVSVLALLAVLASVIIAKHAADDGRRAVVAANRAWVGPINVSLDKAPRIDRDTLIATIQFNKFGKEPAIKGEVIVEPVTVPINMLIADLHNFQTGYARSCLKRPLTGIEQVFFPEIIGSSYHEIHKIDYHLIDWDVIYGLKYIIIRGCIIYDSFSVVRHTAFCGFFQTGGDQDKFLVGLHMCDKGNDAN
jgi:hypothetical protein